MKIMIRKMIKSTSGSKSKLVMSRPTARGYVFPMKPQIQGLGALIDNSPGRNLS